MKHTCDPFNLALYDLVSQYFWDFIPIMAILLFHKNNFSTGKKVVLVVDDTLIEQDTVLYPQSDAASSNEDQIRTTVFRNYRKVFKESTLSANTSQSISR